MKLKPEPAFLNAPCAKCGQPITDGPKIVSLSSDALYHEACLASHGIVITARQFQTEYGGVQQRIPVPDYEHALFFNPATGDHIIVWPMANGTYPQTGCFRYRVR